MALKSTILICAVCALSACSNYSDRGPEGGNREVSSKGYTVRCDAEPKNQPGCYQKTGSSWGLGNLKFSVGN